MTEEPIHPTSKRLTLLEERVSLIEDSVRSVETLLKGDDFNEGFVAEIRSRLAAQETTSRSNHLSNTQRMDSLITTLKLIAAVVITLLVAVGTFSGWKLVNIETAIKAAEVVAK